MAVRAQFCFGAATSSADYRPPKAPRHHDCSLFLDDDPAAAAQVSTHDDLLAACIPTRQANGLNRGVAMFAGEPAGNTSGARKRVLADGVSRPHNPHLVGLSPPQHEQQHRLWPKSDVVPDDLILGNWGEPISGWRPSAEAPVTAVTASLPPITPPVEHEIMSQLRCHQSVDVDAHIRLQNERLLWSMEEMRKRHCRELLTAMEEGVLARHLRQKEAQLESTNRRNAELQEKVRRMEAEKKTWISVARNNEATVCCLRASLEQAFLQLQVNVASAAAAAPPDLEEGCGDSDSVAPALIRAADGQWWCFDEGSLATEPETKSTTGAAGSRVRRDRLWKRRRPGHGSSCKVCSQGEASVVVLPCRHLCLCEQCEPGAAACPVCEAAKEATLHVCSSSSNCS